MDDVIIQGISILGMTSNVLSFQQKTQRGILLFQLVGGALFCIHFILIGAIVGGLLNGLAVVRALIYSNREKMRAESIYWVLGLSLSFIAVYALNFTLLGGEPTLKNFIIECLPVIGMIAATIGMSLGSARSTRLSSYVCSPCWLVYNIVNLSIGGIICESINMVSITVGTIRYDLKGKKQ